MSVRLLLTSGRGPAECRIALAKALDVMRAEAAAMGLAFDVVVAQSADAHGPGSALALVDGSANESGAFARRWVGTILWVAPSPVRPHHRRKNWFIGISVLAEEPVGTGEARVMLREADVRFETFRAGGAGGQHQNKTESAVRATHQPTGLCVVAREERSQHRNKAVALRRLGALIAGREDLAREAEKSVRQARHDELERGRPVRRFLGPRFEEG